MGVTRAAGLVEPSRFVDRGRELSLLEELWRSGEPGLVIVYGRRRVGKTRLLLEWGRGKRLVYYQASLWGHEQNLQGLVEAIVEQLGLEELREFKPSNLRALLRLLARLVGNERLVLVIDEFSYWLRVAEPVLADIQWFVDHVLPSTRILLVLSGSIIGLMERSVAGTGAPLYGRARLRIRLDELPPWCLPFFAPRYSTEQLVELYSLLGGIPHYLRLVDDSLEPLEAWLRLFGPGGVLQDEPLFIMREEFRDPHPYLSLARGLAPGPTSLGKAASAAGMPTSHASRYMYALTSLGFVEEVPLLFYKRRRLYRLRDKALRSWLYLLEPLLISSPRSMQRLRERFTHVVATTWEELAEKHSTTVLAPSQGIEPSMAGKLLSRGEEIDWVIIDSDGERVLGVEAKWSDLGPRDAERIVEETRRKIVALLPTRLRGYRVDVVIYARSCEGCDNVVTARDLPWKTMCK